MRTLLIVSISALIAGSLLAPSAAARGEELTVSSVTPATIGAAASTTIRVTGTGFQDGQSVTLSGCPVTNPGAVYPMLP
jgi:hypothetical protein